MESEELSHLRAMLRTHERRLRALELKKARYGLNVPVEVLIEIEDLQAEIARCGMQIEDLSRTHSALPVVNQFSTTYISSSERKQVEIRLSGNFDQLTPEIQLAVIRAIAGIVEIPPDQVTVLKVMAGSIIFTLELPSEAAEVLLDLYNSADDVISELDIQKVRLVPERELELSKLIQYAVAENEGFQKTLIGAGPYSYELFRRATAEQNEIAGKAIEDVYKNLVRHWVQQHRELQKIEMAEEEKEEIVSQVFTKFRQTMTPAKFQNFQDITSILQYLKMTVHAVAVDRVREDGGFLSTTYALQDAEAAPTSEELANRDALWSFINQRLDNNKERTVLYSSFVLDLRPREIFDQYKNLFESVDEVHRVKQNVIGRLRHDAEFRKLLGTDS